MPFFKKVFVTCRQVEHDELIEANGFERTVRRGSWVVTSTTDGRVRIFGDRDFKREFVFVPD